MRHPVTTYSIVASMLLSLAGTRLWGDDLIIEHDAVLSHNVAGNVVIANGATVSAKRVNIAGNVTITNGASFFGQGVWIQGNLTANSAGDIALRNFNARRSRVFGDIHVRRSTGILRFFNVRADGHLSLEDNAPTDIVIRDSFVLGDLQFFNNQVRQTNFLDHTVVRGSIQARNNLPPPIMRSNLVYGAEPQGALIEIRAAGDIGDERFALELNGQRVREWTATQFLQPYRYLAPADVSADQVRVVFLNDLTDEPRDGRNLFVDSMAIDGQVFQTESPAVFSTGSWQTADGVTPGYRLSEYLHANGYFQFGQPGLGNSVLLYDFNTILPEQGTAAFFNDGFDIWLDVRDDAQRSQLEMRFGSAGVLSEIWNTVTGESLLAPSFQGERTDRVCQWTLWELGTNLVFDLPELVWYADRFNLSQAGNFAGEFNGTVDVELDESAGSLDVWSIVDRQWRPELESALSGSVSNWTHVNALDGGSLLVRRVVRLNETRFLDELVDFDIPHFEFWNPFSDEAFDSLAFQFDAHGNPTHWYADSYNIPEFPFWPVTITQGWATMFDRNQIRSRLAVSVVFGRKPGAVFSADGLQSEPADFVFNSMDFDGGVALMPALEPTQLPPGSIIDQSYLIVFSQGIRDDTGRILDALADRVPQPKIYLPGAALDPEMSAIAERLESLTNEPRAHTDHLGTVFYGGE